MKKLLISSTLLLVACSHTGGSSTDSARSPKGNPESPLLVVEYADLQCPACRSAHIGVVAPLVEAYGDDVRFEFHHFPLRSIHRYALDASEAAECAADQGKFWEYVDTVYENQDDLDTDQLLIWAEQIGLDIQQFERCWKSGSKRDIVLGDYKEGRDLDVGGTPTFFVNGQKVQNGYDTISAAIEAELARLNQKL